LRLTATVRNPTADAHVAALNTQISLRATQTVQRNFGRVSLTAVVDAEGRNFSEKNQLKISAGLTRDAAGENYTVSVDTLIGGATENLLAVRAALPAGQQEFTGQWTLKGRTAQLEPFFLGAALPEFDARGEGRFAFNPSTRAVSLQGNFEAGVSQLEAVEPAWRAIGPVKLQAQFDVAEADGVARLRQLDVRLAGDQPVLTVQATRAAVFNLKERRLQVGGDEAGEILKLKLSGLPLAWVRPFVHAADVSGGMITGGFVVSVEKDRLTARSTEPLRIDALTVVQRGQLVLSKADITLSYDTALVAKVLQFHISDLTLKTPAGDSLSAQGTVAMPLVWPSRYAIAASYSADLPALLAPWLPPAHLKIAGDLDLDLTETKIDLRRFHTVVHGAEDAPLLAAAMLHPFGYDRASRRAATGEKGATDIVRVVVGRLNLDALPLTKPGARLGGVVEQGEFVLTADGDKLRWHTVSQLKLAGVSLAQGDRPALTGLTIEAMPVIELNGSNASTVQTGEVSVRNSAGAAVATFKGESMRSAESGQRGTLTFNLELPALASQPLFAGAQAVSEGRASGEIRVALGTASQVEARLTVNGLVARDSGQTLPVANLSFRSVTQENGRTSVSAPLLLDRAGQRSDLNLGLELTPVGQVLGLDGRLTGEHVELADVLSLLSVFFASTAATVNPGAASASTAPVEADATPAWARFNGQLLVDLKSATSGKDWSMTGLTGLLVIDPARVSLQKIEAAFGEKSRLAAKGDLRFTGGGQPYQLAGEFSLTEFDTGKLFKAIEPARPPTVEGIFSLAGSLAGQGATIDQTIEQTRGRFDLTSRQGIFRGLQRTSNKVSMTSKAVELGASVLGSILGSDKGTKVAEKVAGTAYFVDQLAQSVGELNYDQLSVRLVRDESLDLTLEDFSLVSPEVRLLGKGVVSYAADKTLLEQPLNATLSFAARGKTEQTFGKLHLIDGTRDELGYARAQLPVTIGGTLSRPDPSAFFTKVASSKLTELIAPD
jgi:hypothetical protein